MPGGGARGQNLVHLKKLGFLCLSFLEVYVLANNYVPPTEGGGDILFLVRIPSASASASALLRFRALSFEPMDGF